jgi:hypothetical protein
MTTPQLDPLVPGSDKRRPRGIIHVHSTYSHDGKDSLEELREFAVGHGFGFVGLTDHAEDLDARVFEAYTTQCSSLSTPTCTLIPGLEFRFSQYKGLHLLALGLRRWIEPHTPEEFIALSGESAAFTIVAHPVLVDYVIPPAVLDQVNALEVWNPGYNTRYLPDVSALEALNHLSSRYPRLLAVGGVDMHDRAKFGELYLELRSSATEPLAALSRGDYRIVGKTMSLSARPPTPLMKLATLQWARRVFDPLNRVHGSLRRFMDR